MADEDAPRNSKDSGASGGSNRNNDRKPKSPVRDSKSRPRTSGGSDKPVPNVPSHIVDRQIQRNSNTNRFSKDSVGINQWRRKSPEAKHPTHGWEKDLTKPRSPKNDLRGRPRRSNESDRTVGSVGSSRREPEGTNNDIRKSNDNEQRGVVEVDDVTEPGDAEKYKAALKKLGNAHFRGKTNAGVRSNGVPPNRGSKDSEQAKNEAEDKNYHDIHDASNGKWGNVNKEDDEQPHTDVIAPGGDGVTQIPKGKGMLDVLKFLPPEAIKSIRLKPKTKKSELKEKPINDAPKSAGPIASKVVYLKKPEPPKEQEPLDQLGFPVEEPTQLGEPANVPIADDMDIDDDDIGKRLNELIATYRGNKLRKLKKATKARAPNYKFGDMIKTLNKLGIPCPTNEDFARLHGLHGRWDPDGNIIEYFSPMLRTFIPINMRGRYRGCWPTDDCMKGINISKITPKRDALEGFVERGRHDNIQQKYDDMSQVAEDEGHLDFLVELQAFQAETLPIPIFYDMLHLGLEVANETLRILVQEEGYPPNNYIFSSALTHAEQIRRKIQLYAALGLEALESKRKGLGSYVPQWLKSRDEIIRDSMKSKDGKRFQNFEKMEKEGIERENKRRSFMFARKSAESPSPGPGVSNVPNMMRKMSGRINKVEPEERKDKKKSLA